MQHTNNYTQELIEAIIKASTSFDRQAINVEEFKQEKQNFDAIFNNKQFEPSRVNLALNNSVFEQLKKDVERLPIAKPIDTKADKAIINESNIDISGDFVSAESLINK